jgi:hypothetical protein
MTAALILTAAVVAFICDFLKRNNEQLREMNIELQLRQEQNRAPEAEIVVAPAPVAHVAIPPVPKERAALPKEKKRVVNAEAIAAMERGAHLAAAGGRPRSAPVLELKPEAIVAPRQEPVKTTEVKMGMKKDWTSLLSRGAQAAKPRQPETSLAGLQTGFHDGFVLNKLVQSRQPVSGLVVSIGVNAARQSDGKLPEGVLKLVESLIGPNDFAAQNAEDEFLLIYPQEQGASAQRRLSQIAQQLWDFQLRSLGSLQILFSWGGVEVRSESMEEAIASASERMQETKRGRKLVAMESPAAVGKELQLRKAV